MGHEGPATCGAKNQNPTFPVVEADDAEAATDRAPLERGCRAARTCAGSKGAKGKETVWETEAPDAGGDGAATSAGAGAVAGGGKGKRRADNGSARACIGGASSGGGSGRGSRSGHSGSKLQRQQGSGGPGRKGQW